MISDDYTMIFKLSKLKIEIYCIQESNIISFYFPFYNFLFEFVKLIAYIVRHSNRQFILVCSKPLFSLCHNA